MVKKWPILQKKNFLILAKMADFCFLPFSNCSKMAKMWIFWKKKIAKMAKNSAKRRKMAKNGQFCKKKFFWFLAKIAKNSQNRRENGQTMVIFEKKKNFLQKMAKNDQILKKKNFEIWTKIWNFHTKTPPKTAENGLKWVKMA